MTYRIDPSQFIENGPAIAADAAIARVRRAAFHAAIRQRRLADRQAKDHCPGLPKAA